MNFWNNPENSALKTLVIVVIVAILGFFAYKYLHSNSLSSTGRVIGNGLEKNQQTQQSGFTFATAINSPVCTINVCRTENPSQCIMLDGKTPDGKTPDGKTPDGKTCDLNPMQDTPQKQGLLNLISPNAATTQPAQ